MGDRPKPTALKKLEGVRPYRINKDEPKPSRGIGEAPDNLDDIGKAAWLKTGNILDGMRVMTVADEAALAMYCHNYSTYIKAGAKLKEQGEVIETRTTVKVNPWYQVQSDAQKLMTKFLIEFGMTPASRAGIKVTESIEDDPLMNFLKSRTIGT